MSSTAETRKQEGRGRVWRTDIFPCIPARYVLAVVSSLGFVNVFALRVNLSVAIVQMDVTTATLTNHSARIPGGWLAARIGGRWILGIGIVMTSVFTLLTPLAANVSIWALIAVRVAEGFFEGATFPAMHAVWAKWAPPAERTILTTISYSGAHVGSIISFPLSAILCEYGFDGGWPSVFYVFGCAGILWLFLWILVGYSSPDTHPRISEKERLYIEESIAAQEHEDKNATPWIHILTSPAVWAIIVAHFCNNWGFYTLLTCMPTYFKQAMPSLQISQSHSLLLSGIYSAFPYAFLAIIIPASGFVADMMRRKISTIIVRKIMTLSAFILAGSFLLLCGYLGTTSTVAVIFLTIAVGSLGLNLSGFNCNHLDIAPRYGGVLMGLTNTAGTIPGIVGPYVAKAIALEPSAPKNTTAYLETYRDEWREVFIISAELYAFGAIVYLLLGSGQKQYWSDGWPPKLVQNDSIPVGSSPTIKQCHSIQVEAEKVRLIQGQPQSGTHYGDHSS